MPVQQETKFAKRTSRMDINFFEKGQIRRYSGRSKVAYMSTG